MVAIVSGFAPGLELGLRMGAGGPSAGRNGEALHVNVVTGNLVLQNQDDHLAARGGGHVATRTYNSAGLFDEDNGDQWRMDAVRARLEGALNAPESTVRRTEKDGSSA
ncbi:MAG TPA: DUF6531 domain-containing protein, partial [Ramlibacter sp.]|nr:DUF6531 domain-containing protein [Ramlibacter sp.]